MIGTSSFVRDASQAVSSGMIPLKSPVVVRRVWTSEGAMWWVGERKSKAFTPRGVGIFRPDHPLSPAAV
jgi:hypothetical protein